MKVGFFSPLPPARTGIADYSAALLRALRKRGMVEVAARVSDVNLYHLGNNQIHREIYDQALATPGVAVLHDAMLQHFFLGSLSEQQYVEEFAFNYGEWRRSIGRALWRDRASSGVNAEYFSYPMLKRIAQTSRAVVVHNEAAAEMVRAHAPEARTAVIPHLFEPTPQPDAAEILGFRSRQNIPADGFVFGVFGYLRESKRVLAVLRCFEKLHQTMPRTALLIAGEFVSSDLARAAEPLLRCPGASRVGHLTEPEFLVAGKAVDVCINLRYPSAGETSGIAVRLMGAGTPTLLTRGLETSGYPATACFRIESGIAEESDLLEHMRLLAAFPEVAREAGRQAARHIRECHAPDLVADRYWSILCSSRA